MSSTGEEAPQNIFHCDVLEAAKENILPLAKGRSVATLSAIFSTPHHQRDSRLAATRAQHRANVDMALNFADGDALEAYSRFVRWTIENYPQGHSAESGILELLEEATRLLKNNERWKNDMRYLNLWILYAGYVERPSIIYAFLVANDIGTEHARLYEEYALILERDGRRKQADETLLLGIARRAMPLEHLQNKHRDFQKRMMANHSVAQLESPTEVLESSVVPPRIVLGPFSSVTSILSSSSSSSIRRGTPLATSAIAEDVFSPSATITLQKARPNAKLLVFVDPGPDDSETVEGNAWPKFGTRRIRVKENISEKCRMSETKLKQSSSSTRMAGRSAPAAKIVPYIDPEIVSKDERSPVDDQAQNRNAPFKTPANLTFVPYRDGADTDNDVEIKGEPATPMLKPYRNETDSTLSASVMKLKAPKVISEAEALRKDPLRNHNFGP